MSREVPKRRGFRRRPWLLATPPPAAILALPNLWLNSPSGTRWTASKIQSRAPTRHPRPLRIPHPVERPRPPRPRTLPTRTAARIHPPAPPPRPIHHHHPRLARLAHRKPEHPIRGNRLPARLHPRRTPPRTRPKTRTRPQTTLPGSATISAARLSANARLSGLLSSPATWHGSLAAETRSATVTAAGHTHTFDRGSASIPAKNATLTCPDPRLVSDRLSLLGNATILPDGRLAAILRIVAPPANNRTIASTLFPNPPAPLHPTHVLPPKRL